MRVLVTGAFGIVGLSTVEELLRRGFRVRTFDLPSRKNRQTARHLGPDVETFWGDIRDPADVERAVADTDAVIHLAAIIPPLADRKPDLAEAVNVGGTKNVIRALEAMRPSPRLVFTSSIAVYGDRLANPYITLADALTPNHDDRYAFHKIECESLIRRSRLSWVIFRLSYIVSVRKLKLDPIMFDIPLATSFEICDSRDVALALVNALEAEGVLGETLHIAGGEKCRITYREYLAAMFRLFGLGPARIPEAAFKTGGFHCGFMETAPSERLLHYQRSTLADYFAQVKRKMRVRRFFINMIRFIAQGVLFRRSPYYLSALKSRFVKTMRA